ncbi:sulfatase-like hydrolase/transferase [Aquimarina sp. ERC-38]|uniref:sulfatase-like hydrolase/transferase n=1 Tax=Aquimarina sp. ERC-38 TaxID=2949996 RepID=UPI0022461170|nr:sulfatase-like hydrolase/transferase [Aquimarina sp. ERC-38]UZO82300.1 sulfatase-like hydrolase/transferase [Aquimarina sp. ERC-38]
MKNLLNKNQVLHYILCFFTTVSGFTQMNVVFIESDDQSNQAVGAYGNTLMVTPNIDQLASEGISFTAAYNMGCWSPAVCIPSRTMLMYGKYLWDAKKINRKNAPKSLPEKLQDNGYYTYMTGKWHASGKPVESIFNETGSIRSGQFNTYYTEEGHITDVTASEAANFITNYKGEKPFFAYVAFNAPHVPRETEQQYYNLYPTDKITLPPSFSDQMRLNKNIKYQYAPDPLRLKTMQKRVQRNNAMVTHMDVRIGDIIKALKDKGIYDRTLIVFTSDHGINFGENGVSGKVCLYEPSVTAPLIVKAPGFDANRKINQRVYLQDIAPTLFDLLKLKPMEATDFKSLLPLISKKQNVRNSIYLAMFDDQRGMISGDYKLIIYPETKVLELYNIKKDPWETTNLYQKKESKKIITKLLKELKIWQQKTGDMADLTAIFTPYKI